MNEIQTDLRNAFKLYKAKNYDEALEIYSKHFAEHPAEFVKFNKTNYAWTIYQVYVKDFKSESDLIEAVDFITDLVSQEDLNTSNTCPYTKSIFTVIDLLNDNGEYYNMIPWLSKINPELLSQKKGKYRMSRENYFNIASKAYLECEEYEKCIEVCSQALQSIDEFYKNGDVWCHWKIAKCLKEMGQNQEALKHLKEVIKSKDDWYVFKEFAENHFILKQYEDALPYICQAMLQPGRMNMKVNVLCLAYHILKQTETDIALKHAQLYYLLKMRTGAYIDEEIEDLSIDETSISQEDLEREINSYWSEFKFNGQELQYGTITKFLEDRNFGFIRTQDDESIFFHKKEFKGETIYVGQFVSFYTEENFDKVKNRKSIKAVNVRGE